MTKKIILHPSGKEVPYDDGETVLAALEKNGYALPNNCRAGACGECKIKVRAGDYDQGFILHMALPQEDRDNGYGLMCMAKLKSDTLEIEYGTENALPKLFPTKERMPYLVTEKTDCTPTIVKIRLRSLGKPLKFWPGQYVTFGDPDRGVPERCYSIANIPNHEGEIVLYITRMKDGTTSEWIHSSLQEGHRVYINGPYGTFIGDPSAETPVLCLASGSGLAPIASLASAALMRGGFKHPATILFSARTKNDLIDIGHFEYLKAKYRNFDFKYTLTREENHDGLSGRIPDILNSVYDDLSGYSIYIAGAPEFVEACDTKVRELGAKEDLIHKEGFVSQSV